MSDSRPRPLVVVDATESVEARLLISPLLANIYYGSDQTGRPELFVVPFPDVGASKIQVSRDGAITPRWAHGGGELYFVGLAGMMAASIETDPAFRLLALDTLFALPEKFHVGRTNDFYDVAPGDQRFLMGRNPAPPGLGPDDENPAPILIQNFFSEMRERTGG